MLKDAGSFDVQSLGEHLKLRLARVAHVDDRALFVTFADAAEVVRVQSRLHHANTDPGSLQAGDEVIVAEHGDTLVLLGLIGPLHGADDRHPEKLVLEATAEVTLRVGEGSITIREDGRILIRGRDLVSHAKRLNRIRGGSVAIN